MPAHPPPRRATVRRRGPADPRQPRPAQRHVGGDDGRPGSPPIDELTADRDGAGGGGDRRRARRSAPAATRRGSPASRTPRWTSCAPGCCRSTAPGSRSGRSRCRPSPRSTAPRSAPGCAWRWPATSGTPPPAARLGAPFVKLGMHAGHGRHLPAARGGRARRTPATCCSPAGSSTPTRRSGSGLVSRVRRPRRRSATRCSRPPPGIAATAPIASRLTKLALADGGHADFESAPAVGGAGPADHAGHRGPPGGHPAPPGRSGRRTSAAADRSTTEAEAPVPPTRDSAFPLRISPDGPGGLVWAATLGTRARAGQRGGRHACGQPVDNSVENRARPVEDPSRSRDDAVDKPRTRPANDGR